MNSKKMWQAFAIIALFSIIEIFISFVSAKFGHQASWKLFFALGTIFMVISIVFSFLREKISNPLPALAGNAIACGFFIAAYLVGKKLPVSFGIIVFAAGLAWASYLILMVLFTLPRLNEKGWFIGLSLLVWAVGAGIAGAFLFKDLLPTLTNTTLSKTQINDLIVLYVLFFISVAGLAAGSMFGADTFNELLFGMITPSTFATGFIAVIVLVALACGDGGDCDCGDCCDGCGDGCDCSPDYGGKGKRYKTTMGEMSGGSGATPFRRRKWL